MDVEEVTDDVSWAKGMQNWDFEKDARDAALTTKFVKQYTTALEPGHPPESLVVTLNAIWEFAQKHENLKTLSDDLLKQILATLDSEARQGEVLR